LGVGNALLTGAIEEVLRSGTRHVEDAVIIRPFPQAIPDQAQLARVWEEYRQGLIGLAGIAIFLFGNKRVGADIQLSDGMRREFEIAADKGLILLPIGATGSISADLAREFLSKGGDPHGDEVNKALAALVKPVDDLMSLVEPIASLVRRLKEGR
jgi:Sir2- and TIR-associating SLOG family